MTMAMTPGQAAAAVAAATAERDEIQANLLDLDGSFGKRLLAGATLTGESKHRWAGAAADLDTLWEIYLAYSAVVDRAAGMLAASRHPSGSELAEITALLSGASVSINHGLAPIEQRDLTDSSRSDLTIAAAVHEMKSAYARAAVVAAAAESVWNETADGLSKIATELSTAQEQASGLVDDQLTEALAAAQAELGRLRDTVNSDPLALWRGRVDTSPLDLLGKRTDELAGRAGDLARLRNETQQRIAAATAAVTAAAAARQDAATARDRAAAQVAVPVLPPQPAETAGLDGRLATLDTLRAAGQWEQLASELSVIETEASAAGHHYREAEQAALALLDKRDELRGMLGAYQAKAQRLGVAADGEVTASYQQAHDLLWTVPCDLRAAADPVIRHKEAILTQSERKRLGSDPMTGITR
jgi:hypothetical protein